MHPVQYLRIPWIDDMTFESHDRSVFLMLEALRKQLEELTPDNPALSGWASYSQCDEDGIIRDCLQRIARVAKLSGSFVEIGCADGRQNNTHQMLLDGYRGVWVDADSDAISRLANDLGGLLFDDLLVLQARVSAASAAALASRASTFLAQPSIDLLSLDIDGNDLHVLPVFVHRLSPKLICVEYNAKFPPPSRLAMPYDEGHNWAYDDYFGASLQSWVDVLQEQSYVLVSCNLSGANAFFVREDFARVFTHYPVEALYQPPRYWLANAGHGHPASLKWLAQRLRAKPASFRLVPVLAPSQERSLFAIHQAQDEFISGDLAKTGMWEPFESMLFARLCETATQVLDLGANIGWYSILAAHQLGQSGHIIAFEPDATNAHLLRINAASGDSAGRIEVHQSAVGDQQGELSLFRSTTNLGDHRLFADDEARDCNLVPVITLDEFFASRTGPLPDLVKSDTQGSEARIFRGAGGLLAQGWRPLWILEFWPFGLTRSGDDPLGFWHQLQELGYLTFEVAEHNPVLVMLTEERLLRRLQEDLSPNSWGFINLLCIPRDSEVIERVRDLMASHNEVLQQ